MVYLELESEQIVSLETCLGQTNFDTDISVFTGTCDDLTCFEGFNGDGYVDGDSGCEVQNWAAGGEDGVFTAPAGTYYIMVHGFGSSTSGDFTLSVSCEDPPACVPASDLNTEVVSNDCVDGEGTYTVAVSFSDDGSAEEYVVSNDVNDETANVAADGSAEFTFASGTTVIFTAMAVGFDDCMVEGDVLFSCPPANDLCGDAIPVACNQNVFGSNV
ncbi:MAG: hypothetical protein LC687_08300, partial [Actinobacteria bacterium]|nr:hypothetical protein [Actinomycetota bacterium]